ncbi:AAA family ATPase [Phenylobacterium sp.]|uniref:AAA family ATPase n=1 Tax=Phenylobacterium sp. TaxID=1871053 RepID=UPI00289B3D76|nr:AAA family ATPase [Phenylobacterium sp.]
MGVAERAIGGAERFASIAALFPHVEFEALAGDWPEPPPGLDVLVVSLEGGAADAVEAAVRRLSSAGPATSIVVALHDADVTTTRRLVRAGAADVVTYPISEPALALSLERLLADRRSDADSGRARGEVVAFLKAGGGVGATALGVQTAACVAARGAVEVCLADLDLQFGAAGLYLDLPEAITLADCLSSGANLADTPFATALARHRSGARVLAAPREIVALEMLSPDQIEALLRGLRRDFQLVLVDLPPVWTAWTNQVLHEADRIVLVTQLTVPHVQLVKRQLRVLSAQGLEGRPLTLVCNGVNNDQAGLVSLKAAERAIGREFDVVVPEDRKTMIAAINEGVELSAVRKGTKLEKAVVELAGKLATLAPAAASGWRRG